MRGRIYCLREVKRRLKRERLKGTWASQAVVQSPSLGNRLKMQRLGLSVTHNGCGVENTNVFILYIRHTMCTQYSKIDNQRKNTNPNRDSCSLIQIVNQKDNSC